MTEEWLPIEDFPAYCVSNLGNVKRTATITGKPMDRVLRPTLREGYRVVVLCDRGRRIIRRIGRMVAKAFLPNPNNLPLAVHVDGNSQNDKASNLAWMSYKEASNLDFWKSRLSEGRKKCVVARKKGSPKEGSPKEGSSEIVMKFKALSDAAEWLQANGRAKAAASHIVECCRGRIKSAYGFVWSYVTEDEDGRNEAD